MDFKKLWLWFSAILTASAILFFGLNIPLSFLDGFLGLDFYHFVILGIVLFPFLLKYLVKKANEKIFPNYFLWFVIFAVIAIAALSSFLLCDEYCDWLVAVFLIYGIISFVIATVIFIKSKRLS